MADPRIKQIRIKTGVVKRLAKEKVMYEKEALKEKEKLEKMQSSGEDSYMIRKQFGQYIALVNVPVHVLCTPISVGYLQTPLQEYLTGITQFEEVIKESMMMIPDTVKRYQMAFSELQDILDNEQELAENEEYQAAQEVLKESSKIIAASD